MNLISGDINRFAHKLRKVYSTLTWKQAFNIAYKLKFEGLLNDAYATQSILGSWTRQSQYALAGHFWALKCLYNTAGDKGRSFAFGKIADQLYASLDAGYTLGFGYAVTTDGWGSSVINELLDFYICARSGDDFGYIEHTDRVIDLMMKTGTPLGQIHLPFWQQSC